MWIFSLRGQKLLKLMFLFIKPIKTCDSDPSAGSGSFHHVSTCYYLLFITCSSGQANKPNNPKLLSVGSDMPLFGSLENIEPSATEI